MIFTLATLNRGDFGVSISARGNVRKTNVSAATMPMTMLAIPTLRVMSKASEKKATTHTERNACDIPAR